MPYLYFISSLVVVFLKKHQYPHQHQHSPQKEKIQKFKNPALLVAVLAHRLATDLQKNHLEEAFIKSIFQPLSSFYVINHLTQTIHRYQGR